MAARSPEFRAQRTPLTGHATDHQILFTDIQGTPPLTLQWFHDGAAISGATNRFLAFEQLAAGDGGFYVLVASNAFGQAASPAIELKVDKAPYLQQAVSRKTVPIGGDLCLEARATGAEPMSIQWSLNGVTIDPSTNFSGLNSHDLCLKSARLEHAGIYSVTLSNSVGMITRPVAKVVVSEIMAWGDNSLGQLDVPETATNLIMISAGERHNLALRADGTVVGWGDNLFGQAYPPSTAVNIVSIAAGAGHSLALAANGKVIAWGDNSYGQCETPESLTNVVAIAAGRVHSVALRLDGSVVTWGKINTSSYINSLSNIVAIAATDWTGLALKSDGSTVECWDRWFWSPAPLTGIKSLDAGSSHTIAAHEDGTLIAWGGNYASKAAIPPALSSAPRAFSAGGDHNLALLEDNTLVAWGENYAGETSTPTSPGLITAISAGGVHNLALIGQSFAPLAVTTPMVQVSGEAIHLLLRVDGLRGSGPVTIFQSSDCFQWIPIHTNAPVFGRLHFVDHPAAPGMAKFYRISEGR